MRRLVVLLALAALAAFPASATAEEGAKVTVVHGISGGSLGLADFGFPVDVWVSGAGCVLTGFTFADIAGPLALPAGTYDLRVHRATPGLPPCSREPVLSADDVSLSDGLAASVVAHLDGDGQPTLSIFVDETGSVPDGRSRVTVRHTAWAPEVDVLLQRLQTQIPAGTFVNGEEIGPVVLDNGVYGLGVALPGTSVPVFGYFDQRFGFDRSYVVYAVGNVANGTLALLVQERLDD